MDKKKGQKGYFCELCNNYQYRFMIDNNEVFNWDEDNYFDEEDLNWLFEDYTESLSIDPWAHQL